MKSFLKTVFATIFGLFIGSALLVLTLIIIGVALMKNGTGAGNSQNVGSDTIESKSILHLKIHGEIVERKRPLDFDITSASSIFEPERNVALYEMNRALQVAKKDARIKGVFLDIEDFEGGWAAVFSLEQHLKDFAKSGKWIYAYADRMNEKGYLLASAATRIYMEPSGEFELNGLSVTSPFLKGLFEKLDVEPRIFRVGRFKAAVEPLIRDKMSDENREQNQVLLNDIWTVARKEIATSLKISEAKIDQITAGLEATSAAQAAAAGLISKTLFVDEVEDLMKTQTVGKDKELQYVSVNRLLREPAAARGSGSHQEGKKIAVIFADGEIKSGPVGRDEISPDSLHDDLEDARDDKDVSAVVVRVNSPGGDAQASDVMWRDLKMADQEMPVVISMGDVAASGGYYMSAAGRYIFAEPTTITGSIGVFGVMFDTEKFFKAKAGVNFDRVVTHPFSDIGNSNRPMSPMEAQVIQRDVDRVYKRFLDVVQEGRGFKNRSDLESIAEGRVWSGVRAKEIGLVDELGGLDQAIAKAAELGGLGKDYDVEIFPSEQDSFGKFLAQLTGNAMIKVIGPQALTHLRIVQKALHQTESLKPGIHMRMLEDLEIN